MWGGVIICLRAIPCIVERLRAVTGYSESDIIQAAAYSRNTRKQVNIRLYQNRTFVQNQSREKKMTMQRHIFLFFFFYSFGELKAIWGVRGNLTRKRFCQYIVRTKSVLATSWAVHQFKQNVFDFWEIDFLIKWGNFEIKNTSCYSPMDSKK